MLIRGESGADGRATKLARFLFLLLSCAAASASVRAQTLDGAATTPGPALIAAAEHITAAPFDRIGAYTLTYVILADGNVTPAEEDLLHELMAEGAGNLSLSGPDGTMIVLTLPQEVARQVFGLILEPAPLDSLWMTGQAQMSRLGAVAYLSPATWVRIRDFVARKLEPAWAQSSYLNGYSTLVTELAAVEDQIVPIEEDELISKTLQGLVYEAVMLLNAAHQHGVPAFVYEWLAHEPPYRPYGRVEASVAP